MDWDVLDLGTVGYAEALALQRERNRAVGAGEARSALMLLEHEPVITVSHRRGVRDHVLAAPEELNALGIAVQDTDRGGDVTYHGPGQLVAYPIIRLNDHGLNLGRYMRLLEAAVIDTAAQFGVVGQAEPGATGVWVASGNRDRGPGIRKSMRESGDVESPPGPRSPIPVPCSAKLCAMGVRIRKNTTMHGLALNITTDLSHFETIDPCGLGGRPVTSLSALLGEACPSMERVKQTLTDALASRLRAGVGSVS